MHPVLALACAAALQGPAPATAKTADDPSRVEFLWAGMVDGRQRLRSGVFRGHGRLLDDDPRMWGRLEGNVEVFCAFDFSKGLLRFDRREPGRVAPRGAKIVPGVTWRRVTRGGKYIRVPGKTISQEDGATAIQVSKEERIFPLASPFDPRGVGLFYWRNLEQSTPFDKLVSGWMSVRPEAGVEESEGVARIRWTTLKTDSVVLRRDLWIDTKKGYTPIRHELRNRRPSDPEDRWSEPKTVSEATWAEVSGVWVPKTFRLEEKHALPKVKQIEMALEWESVNQPVPEELFTIEGLKPAAGNTVVDSRTGKPVLVGLIGKDHKPEVGTGSYEPVARPSEAPASGGRRWPTVLILISLAILGVLAAGAWSYRRRSARGGD